MKKELIILTVSLALFTACGQKENKTDAPKEEEKSETINETPDKTGIISATDNLRAQIEKEIETIKPFEILTTELREKIKQKWSKIHYYLRNNEVVRIKTYPYEQITKRTEEFYFDGGKLILVIIEDVGDTPKGKTKKEIDKMYYFKDDKMVEEMKNSNEKEYNIKNSEAEELLQEAKEYLDIYQSKK